MSFAFRKLAPLLLLPLLTQCGTTSAPETAAVTGPFDSRGNYIEDWVDQPDKWYKPIGRGTQTKTPPLIAKTSPLPTRQIENFVPNPVRPPGVAPSRPEMTVVKVTPRPTPKVKPKPKPKPKPVIVRHTVRRGDTLSGLARRYGSSISKIKAANRISGSIIRLGQTLVIPK